MTTSGTTAFNMTVDEIIIEAFKKIGNQPIGAEDSRTARTYLNLLFLDMTNRGASLSNVVEKSVALVPTVQTITLDSEDVDIVDMVVSDGNTQFPLTRYSASEFLRIPNKATQGRPNIFSVNRNRDLATVNFWPIPQLSTYTATYYVITKVEDVTASTETIDLPTRYLNPIIYGLAALLCDYRTDVDPNTQTKLETRYEAFLGRAMDEDAERVSMQVTPYPYIGTN